MITDGNKFDYDAVAEEAAAETSMETDDGLETGVETNLDADDSRDFEDDSGEDEFQEDEEGLTDGETEDDPEDSEGDFDEQDSDDESDGEDSEDESEGENSVFLEGIEDANGKVHSLTQDETITWVKKGMDSDSKYKEAKTLRDSAEELQQELIVQQDQFIDNFKLRPFEALKAVASDEQELYMDASAYVAKRNIEDQLARLNHKAKSEGLTEDEKVAYHDLSQDLQEADAYFAQRIPQKEQQIEEQNKLAETYQEYLLKWEQEIPKKIDEMFETHPGVPKSAENVDYAVQLLESIITYETDVMSLDFNQVMPFVEQRWKAQVRSYNDETVDDDTLYEMIGPDLARRISRIHTEKAGGIKKEPKRKAKNTEKTERIKQKKLDNKVGNRKLSIHEWRELNRKLARGN